MLVACSTIEAYQQIVRLQGLGAESKAFLAARILLSNPFPNPQFQLDQLLDREAALISIKSMDIGGEHGEDEAARCPAHLPMLKSLCLPPSLRRTQQ